MPLTDPIALLERTDKWYLGNGGMLIYAPAFPRYLQVPGFWDECHFGDIALERLLCVSIVAEYAQAETGRKAQAQGAAEQEPEPASAGDEPYPGYLEGVRGNTLTMIKGDHANFLLSQLTGGRIAPIPPRPAGAAVPFDVNNLSRTTVLDLSGVSFFDSAGLGYMVVLLKHIIADGKELVLCSPNQHVRRLLESIRIEKYCRIFDSCSEAMQYASSRSAALRQSGEKETIQALDAGANPVFAPETDTDGKKGEHRIRPYEENPPRTTLVELEAHTSYWRWFPDRIEVRHYLVERDGIGFKQQRGVRIFLDEVRRIGPDSTLHCDLSFEVLPGCEVSALHVVGWTAQRRNEETDYSAFSDMPGCGDRLSFTLSSARRPHGRSKKPRPLTVSIWGDPGHHSIEAVPAHGANLAPLLRHTPLWDSLKSGRLSGSINGENTLGSTVFAGLHWKLPVSNLQVDPLKLRVRVEDEYGQDQPEPALKETANGGYHRSLATPDPQEAWREFLSLVPHFECSSELLTRYYWYRWYGLRLNALPAGGKYSHPAVTEGISYFRGVITYSLMCHLNECKWLSDPALALGCLRNHVRHQSTLGHFPGHIYYSHVNKKGFYHTDIGRALVGLMQHHPGPDYASEFTKPLRRLLHYYLSERDREGLDLFDVRDQYETGQEFTSRYFHGDDKADLHGWDHKLRLKGVDVTAYVYHLAVLLKELAIRSGQVGLVDECVSLAGRIRQAVRTKLWDADKAYFVDYLAKGQQRSPYLPATGLWPLLSDLATGEQALAAGRHLLSEADGGTGKFVTAWPTPTVPPDDPYFSADPVWRGERANCPWNGRVWPMVNSHIADVLGRLSALEPERYRPQLARYVQRFIELMHFDSVGANPVFAPETDTDGNKGEHRVRPYPNSVTVVKDLLRPNCFEHYHPYDGTACEYRGIDDYMHSWVSDLLLKYVCGVRFEGSKLVVDPLPFNLDWFLLKDCHIAGHRLDVCWNRNPDGSEGRGFRVYVDGSAAFESDRLESCRSLG